MKRKILSLVLLFTMFLPVFSNEVIRINIGDEIYEREYPDTVEEYRKLIDGLIDMYNDLNSDYLIYLDNDERSSDELRNLISALENDNNRLKSDIYKLSDEYAAYKKSVDKLLKTNSKFTLFTSIGPAISNKSGIGMQSDFIFDFRLFRNLHFGLNAGLSVYNNNEVLIEGRFGLVLGYSIY